MSRLRCVALGAALALTATTGAQDVYFPEGRDSVTVPMRWFENGFLPTAAAFVEARLGDSAEAMLLDTGAGLHIVSEGAVKRLQLQPGNKMFAIAMSDTQKTQRYHLPIVDLGGMTIENAMAMQLPLDRLFRTYRKTHGIEAEGILGAGLFSIGPVTLDFENERLTIRDQTSAWEPPDDAIVVKLAFQLGQPVVRASLAGLRPARFIIDTGNNGVLLVHGPYAKKRGFVTDSEGMIKSGIHGAFGGSEGVQALIPSLEVGDLRCEDVPALIVTDGDTGAGLTQGAMLGGNIGLGFLARFARVTFDYRGRRLVLERRGNDLQFPEGFGLRLRIRQGVVCVEQALAGSPADDAGLRLFDVLKTIDGAPCPATVTETVRLLRQRDRVTLRVGRYKSEDREVTLQKRPLLVRAQVKK